MESLTTFRRMCGERVGGGFLSRINVLRRTCYESLLSETDPSHDVLEARVPSQVIPFWFDFQKNHFRVSLLDTSLQPDKCVVALVQAVIDQRDVLRRNVTLGR